MKQNAVGLGMLLVPELKYDPLIARLDAITRVRLEGKLTSLPESPWKVIEEASRAIDMLQIELQMATARAQRAEEALDAKFYPQPFA